MPLSHEDVTATVFVTGLALGCYNATTQNYEVGLLRQGCHLATIEVIKQLQNGGSSRLKFELDNNHRIFIDTENGILPEDPFYRSGDTFDRTDRTHDNEDFRWVVDFEKELNNDEEVVLKPPVDPEGDPDTGGPAPIPVTEMYVSKPLLYADPAELKPRRLLLVDKSATGETPTLFGYLTEGVKADVKCQASGAVVLRVEGPQGFQIHLPHNPNSAHLIKVDNSCPDEDIDDDEASDFNMYYSVIEATNGTQFDVQLENREQEGEGAVCNGSFLGVRGSLFPLPDA
jgi:hypothetical protein